MMEDSFYHNAIDYKEECESNLYKSPPKYKLVFEIINHWKTKNEVLPFLGLVITSMFDSDIIIEIGFCISGISFNLALEKK